MDISNKFLEWLGGIVAVITTAFATFKITKKKYIAETDLSTAQTKKVTTEERKILMDELKEVRKELQEMMDKNFRLEQELIQEREKGKTLLRRITVLETYPFQKKN